MSAPSLDHFEMTSALSDLTSWLIQQGLENTPVEVWLGECCNRLVAAGIPLQRVNIGTRGHHPEIGGVAFRWRRDEESERIDYGRSSSPNTDYRQSPLYYLLVNPVAELRQDLTDPNPELEFPIFEDLRAQGSTEYYAAIRSFLDSHHDGIADPTQHQEGMTISMTTDAEGGFTDVQLNGLRDLLPSICLTLKSGSNRKMAEDITAAYLGEDASKRVLSGAIQRGSCETLSAVIWYFDLQGFTKMSEELPGTAIISLLNDYFAEAVDVVESHGGNVLKFMGDGMLAVFDLDSLPDARLTAVEAAVELRGRIDAMNADRAERNLPRTGFTLGLHAGNVLYGNIGGKTRLDFTVIGRAVNTTARILGMSDPVGQNIVISSAVAGALLDIRSDLVSLGAYRLRGVLERQELYTLD